MRLIHTLFFSVITMFAFAQKQVETIFYFSEPTGLTPAIVPASSDQGRVGVTDKVFTSGAANVSFIDEGGLTGAQIRTSVGSASTSYYLVVTSGTSMTVQINEAINIESISLGEGAVNGGLYLMSDQPGTYSGGDKKWTNNSDENVTSVKFKNTGNNTEIRQLHVVYTVPENILTPSYDIEENSTLPEFSSIKLYFTDIMECMSEVGIKLIRESDSAEIPLSVTVDENTVTLSVSSVINVDGSYKIVVPSHCFKTVDGFYNKDLEFTFIVDTPKNTLNYTSVTPSTGRVSSLPLEFMLSYDVAIGHVDDCELALMKDDAIEAVVKISKVAGDDKAVKLIVQNLTENITSNGIYTITVPTKTIYNAYYNSETFKSQERWNPEFTLSYEISDAPIKSSTMIEAEELLKTEGVGYPKSDSDSRVALKALLDQAEMPSDAQLLSAMQLFYSETSVELPSTGKYYTIASVNSNGSELYLSESEGSIVLDHNRSNAISFEATANNDGTITFKTSTGKYLHVLVGSEINEAKPSNMTNEYVAKLNNLSFKKLSVGDDPSKTFGLFYMNGGVGINVINVEENANALINFNSSAIVTSLTINDLFFATDLTSAFKIEEVLGPVDVDATLTPTQVVSNNESLTLKWADTYSLTFANVGAPYFTNSDNVKVASASLVAVEGSSTEYEVSLTGLAEGDYSLVIPDGTFTCIVDGKNRIVKGIVASFSIFNPNGSGDDSQLSETYEPISIYNSVAADVPITDVSLNDFAIYVDQNSFSGLVVDPNKTIKLYDIRKSSIIREGHLVNTVLADRPNTWAVKVQFEPAIVEGELRKDSYQIILERGTIGDANFGLYLNDKSSIEASACKINPRMTFTRYVNNDLASSIDGVEVDGSEDGKIYDFMGRPVNSMNKKGLYIVNGKKVAK